jgi:protein involved in polysaccharide export with SLBB domain
LRSPGIRASLLPDEFRMPVRAVGPALNFAALTTTPPQDYLLGAGDVLNVTIPELFPNSEIRPLEVSVMSSGEVHLPLVGAVRVGGMNLMQAQEAITRAYADGFLNAPKINVALLTKSTVDIVVLGEVNSPGVYPLPRYQNDVAHALAAAGGMTRFSADAIEIHRRRFAPSGEVLPPCNLGYPEESRFDPVTGQWLTILRIPLRGIPSEAIPPGEIIVQPGDVVVVPSRSNEVFFVVGRLNQTNLVRFTLGDRERELGTGLVLPREREIDVVTAVAMAGYIDPIDSPTTVTVHRVGPDGRPMLIHVDLIAARYDPRETVLVRAGDIIYLNPDAAWWWRRTIDRVVPELILVPYRKIFNP